MTAALKRVLFLMPSLVGGGAERVIVTLLQHLDRSRFEPHLALVDAIGPLLKDVPAHVPRYDLKAERVRCALSAEPPCADLRVRAWLHIPKGCANH